MEKGEKNAMELQNTFSDIEYKETEFLSEKDLWELPNLNNVFILTLLSGYFLLIFFVILSFLIKMI